MPTSLTKKSNFTKPSIAVNKQGGLNDLDDLDDLLEDIGPKKKIMNPREEP